MLATEIVTINNINGITLVRKLLFIAPGNIISTLAFFIPESLSLLFKTPEMGTASNLRIFSIAFLFLLTLKGCERDKNDVIPDVYVDFYLDLTDPEFFPLTAVGNFVIVTSATNNIGADAAGFSGNGIIVYRSMIDEFNAYDRTCPHDYATNGTSIRVNADGIYAVCPDCGTNYALPSFGTPTSGPGRYPLKNYRTSFDGRFIRVWNRL
jgi:nitrite reductase/ring-hydroxylating ferredoxin subunit